MKAIIMAGGEGSRLRPLTCDLPKPMIPIMNKPAMQHIVELLKSHGITEIGVTLMYLPQKIKDYFGNGSSFGVNLHYFTEDSPLGTAGSVKNAEGFLDETFVVISGDSVTDINLTDALAFHKSKASQATLVLSRVDIPLEYGMVLTGADGEVTGFLEKPSWGEVFSDTVNTGIYILEPEVMKNVKSGEKHDFSSDLFPMLLQNNKPVYGYITSDYWCDIGDLRWYFQAHSDIFEGKLKLNIDADEIQKGVWVGHGTVIESNAQINGPCLIGNNCHIGNGTVIENYSVIGDNNSVEDEVSIKRSIIWDNCSIDYGSEIRGAILCSKVSLKHYVSVFENAVIGDRCKVSERVIIKPNIKIWPQKSVDPLAVVDRNIVWGAKRSRSIFGENGLSGIINIDISPEFATRLGAAYGSMFPKGSRVVVSSTTSNSARMFKHAFISGILSVGVEVFNLSSLLTPISRYAVNYLSVEGGIHIKVSDDNANKLHVVFMDFKGADISKAMERKIENTFFREDFKRCSGAEISRLNNITDFKSYYMRSIINKIDILKVNEKSPRILLISPSDFVISVVTSMLEDIGCRVSVSFSPLLEPPDRIAGYINKNAANFAAFIDSNGEKLILIDKYGQVITEDLYTALTSLILFKSETAASVVVPVTAPSVIDALAEKYNGRVIRTKSSAQATMAQMLTRNTFRNHENLDQFLLSYDAPGGLAKIIEYLCINNTTLTDIVSEIPEFHISKKNVFCPWELKGKVMRRLITEKSNTKMELFDGVKFITEDGWVLVLPDSDIPMCRVYSEGTSQQSAEEISGKYMEKIRMIIDSA